MKIDNQLKEFNKEYRNTIINFAMDKIMEIQKRKNKVIVFYLINCKKI